VVLMLPLPVAAPQAEPAPAAHVHVAPVIVAGKLSTTVAPVAVDGPAFKTLIVYVTDVPGTFDVTPSDLVIDRSPDFDNVSLSVAELLPALTSVMPTGAVIEAVFVSVPPSVPGMVTTTANVAVPPTAKLTGVLIAPAPDATPHDEPTDATHVHPIVVMPAGSASVTVAPVTGFGPPLVAIIV
jgi:hypothetical protein